MTLKDKVFPRQVGTPSDSPTVGNLLKPFNTDPSPYAQALRDYTFPSATDTETLDSKQRAVARAWFTNASFIQSMIPLSNGSIEQLHDSLTLLDDV